MLRYPLNLWVFYLLFGAAAPLNRRKQRRMTDRAAPAAVPLAAGSPMNASLSGSPSSASYHYRSAGGVAATLHELAQASNFAQYVESQQNAQVIIDGDDGGVLFAPVAATLDRAFNLRKSFSLNPLQLQRQVTLPSRFLRSQAIPFRDGVVALDEVLPPAAFAPVDFLATYYQSLDELHHLVEDVDCIKCAAQRLSILEQRSKTTFLLNADSETATAAHQREGGVFAPGVVRVDNSVHLHRAVPAGRCIDYFVDLMIKSPDDIVARDSIRGSITVREMFGDENPVLLTPERLGWTGTESASRSTRHRAAGAATKALGLMMMNAALRPDGRLFQAHFRRHLLFLEQRRLGMEADGDRYPLPVMLEVKVPVCGIGKDELATLAKVLKDLSSSGASPTQQQQAPVLARLPTVSYFLNMGLNNTIDEWFRAAGEGEGGVSGAMAPSGAAGDIAGDGPRSAHQTAFDLLKPPRVHEVVERCFRPLLMATLTESSTDPLHQWLPGIGGITVESTVHASRVAAIKKRWTQEVRQAAMSAADNAASGAGGSPSPHDRPPAAAPQGGKGVMSPPAGPRGREGPSSSIAGMSQTQRGELTILEATEDYFEFLVWANLQVLNTIRGAKGLRPWQLRRGVGGVPASHSASATSPLLTGYLLADHLTNAALVHRLPVLEYLCGLSAIGLVISPLSDNSRGHVAYAMCPLKSMLYRGLRVTLATEEPLLHHQDADALLEEYGTAAKLCRLEAMDIPELSRNSVLISALPQADKLALLGEQPAGDVPRSHVSAMRIRLRDECWRDEHRIRSELVKRGDSGAGEGASSHVRMTGAAAAAAGVSRWNRLTSVKDFENFSHVDSRISFPRVVISRTHQHASHERAVAARKLAQALRLRYKYIWPRPKPWRQGSDPDQKSEDAFKSKTKDFDEAQWTFEAKEGIFVAYPRSKVKDWPEHLPTLEQFHRDMVELKAITDNYDVKTLSHERLEALEHRFQMHLALNHANEAGSSNGAAAPTRDFYHCAKVDTHVHMAAGMTARQMKDFVVQKLQHHPDDIVLAGRDGQVQTLGQLAQRMKITPNLTVDMLNVQADHTLFERFDNFNSKYNP